jgi:hypothetical protein
MSTPFNWRDHLKVHPAADLFPLMSESELKELAADIKENGLLNPILLASTELLDESGKRTDVHTHALLDGRNRLDALAMLGWLEPAEKPKKLFFRGLSLTRWHAPIKCVNIDDDALFNFGDDGGENSTVISLNVRRRHLTAEQKRDLIARLLKLQPESSNRQIAKTATADHKTVGSVRSELEATGEIPQLDKTVGADGKSRKQKPKEQVASAMAGNAVDPETSAEQRKAIYADPEPEAAAQAAQPDAEPEPERTVVTKATLMAIVAQIPEIGRPPYPEIIGGDLELYDALYGAASRLSYFVDVAHYDVRQQLQEREDAEKAQKRHDRRVARLVERAAERTQRAEQAAGVPA